MTSLIAAKIASLSWRSDLPSGSGRTDQNTISPPNLKQIAVSYRTTLEGLTQFPFMSPRTWQQMIGTTEDPSANMREGRFCATLFQTTRNCQATGETDPLPTLKLTPPDLMFSVHQREPAAPASAHSDPKLHRVE